MSKRLILVLALAFVVGFSFAAYAEVQNVKVSGDITAYGIARHGFGLQKVNPTDSSLGINKENALASIARVRVDADLTDNVVTTVRLLNERYWGREANSSENLGDNSVNSDISLDLAYVTLKEFLYSPLSLIVGRQELHFGNDMILGDPDTNNNVTTASPFGANNRDKDLSARKAFDAIRLTLNYDPLVIDAIVSKIQENNLYLQDDVDLYGINANYKLAKMNTTVEGYYFNKRTGRDLTKGTNTIKKVDSVDVIGGRLSTQPIENFTYTLEAAYQFGTYVSTIISRPTVDRKAWGLETALNYNFKKVKFTPDLTVIYAYFSGNKTVNRDGGATFNTLDGAYRAWDPMFENQKFGDIANALFNQSNVHLIGGALSAKPLEDITLKGEYYAYWWAKAYPEGGVLYATARSTLPTGTQLIMTQKRMAGQELDLTATYDYTEDVQFGLMGGWFVPGASFEKKNDSVATEVIGSMKVTF